MSGIHTMTTRSKSKDNKPPPLHIEDDDDDSVDENGNLKGFIDYDCEDDFDHEEFDRQVSRLRGGKPNKSKKIKKENIENYLKPNTKLWSHISRANNNFLKFSFGALGYGLGIAAGMSLGYQIEKKPHIIFCILSDGELNEGSIWESLMFISHHNLKNIVILVDHNKLQSFGSTSDVINLNSYRKKFKSFNFNFFEIDGHNVSSLIKIFKLNSRRPKVVLCNTVKGKGLKRIEGLLSSHYYPAKKEDLELIN